MTVINLFAGPGGLEQGAATLGITDIIGIDSDPDVCLTRSAAALNTVPADVTTANIPQTTSQNVKGLLASPPCPQFSQAGSRHGQQLIPELVDDIHMGMWPDHRDRGEAALVLEVGAWAEKLNPRWIVCEQVPPALPLWHAYAHRLRSEGWAGTWAGVLNAADYGVPQTRVRAILIAHRDRPVLPPTPTHERHPQQALIGPTRQRWVSMADALGWPPDVELQPGSMEHRRRWPASGPAPTVAFGHDVARWVWHMPATTVAGDPRISARCHHDHGMQGTDARTTDQVRAGDYDGTQPIRLTLREALVLQGFPADYPVAGGARSAFRQVGNAVPPQLAAAILAQVAAPALETAA